MFIQFVEVLPSNFCVCERERVCVCVHLPIFIVFDCVRILHVYTCTHVYIEFICECAYLCLSVCMYYKRVGTSQTCDVYIDDGRVLCNMGLFEGNARVLCSNHVLLCFFSLTSAPQNCSFPAIMQGENTGNLLHGHSSCFGCIAGSLPWRYGLMRTGRKSSDPLMALMGATPFTQDMEIWIYHCQHRSMTSTSRLDLCHLSTPSCFRQLFQQHIMLPLCLHLGRNHLVQGFLHSLLLLKNHGMFVLIETNEAEGWERFQTLTTY